MVELVLIRGLPGSGKTTLAKSMTDYIHFETDMFWGEPYEFDVNRLVEAHEWCQKKVETNLNFLVDVHEDGYDSVKGVVVSNTFSTYREMQPYFDIAWKFGIKPQIIICQGEFGSVHSVPEDVVLKMKKRFEFLQGV